MIITSITLIRSNTATPWFCVSNEFRDANYTAYYHTGKLTATYSSLSEDGLTLNLSNHWKSKAEFENFAADPIGITMKEARLLYCITNDITLDYHAEIVNDEHDPMAT